MSILPEIGFHYVPEKPVKCQKCKWEGTLRECKEKRYVSDWASWAQLAGRDGWQYYCPLCGYLIDEYWIRMS